MKVFGILQLKDVHLLKYLLRFLHYGFNPYVLAHNMFLGIFFRLHGLERKSLLIVRKLFQNKQPCDILNCLLSFICITSSDQI